GSCTLVVELSRREAGNGSKEFDRAGGRGGRGGDGGADRGTSGECGLARHVAGYSAGRRGGRPKERERRRDAGGGTRGEGQTGGVLLAGVQGPDRPRQYERRSG